MTLGIRKRFHEARNWYFGLHDWRALWLWEPTS